MPENFWWVWIIFAALFIVGEIFTAAFFLLWFGVGAAVAGIGELPKEKLEPPRKGDVQGPHRT